MLVRAFRSTLAVGIFRRQYGARSQRSGMNQRLGRKRLGLTDEDLLRRVGTLRLGDFAAAL